MRTPKIGYTDNTCIIEGKVYDNLPVLLNSNFDIVVPVTNYIRYCAIDKNNDYKTLNNIALALKSLCQWLEHSKLDWTDMTQSLFRQWRNETRERISIKNGYRSEGEKHKCEPYIDANLRYLYEFYWWAQQHGYYPELMGTGLKLDKVKYPIPITFVNKGGAPTNKIKCPILYRTKYKPVINMPTDEDIDRLGIAMVTRREKANDEYAQELIVRDSLIISWCNDPALREAEVACLQKDDLPSLDQVEEDERREMMCKILIKHGTKFGKHRNVQVHPSLVLRTWNYIHNERVELLKGRIDKKTPPEVFISSKTRKALKPATIYKIISDYSDGKISPHPLRHRGLTDFAMREIDYRAKVGAEKIELKGIGVAVSEQGGHNHPDFTMNTYVHPAQRRRENDSGYGDKLHWTAGEVKALRRQIKEMEQELEKKEHEVRSLKKQLKTIQNKITNKK